MGEDEMAEAGEAVMLERQKNFRKALQLIAQMRQAQKAYFKSRNKEDLIASKRLETAVDAELSRLGIKAV